MDQWFADHHQHRKPTIIRVLSHVDGIDGVELSTSGAISVEDSGIIGAMVNQVKTELGDTHVIPVVLKPKLWNLDAIAVALEAQALAAINVQRSRKSHQRSQKETSFRAITQKGGEAAVELLKLGKRVVVR